MPSNVDTKTGLTDITSEVWTTAAHVTYLSQRIRYLSAADRMTSSVMKAVADGTKMSAGQYHHYRAGFGWRVQRCYDLEQEAITLMVAVFVGSTVELTGREPDEIIGYRLADSWSNSPFEAMIITRSLGNQDPQHLASILDAGAQFFRQHP